MFILVFYWYSSSATDGIGWAHLIRYLLLIAGAKETTATEHQAEACTTRSEQEGHH